MKKIILFVIFPFLGIAQSQYKYCELVGFQKFFSYKCYIAVDSGQSRSFWKQDFTMRDTDSSDASSATEYKNEKFYVTTDKDMYEGKSVQSDSKGKFIWKKVDTNKQSGTEPKTKRQTFNSMVEGMNKMGQDGWEFVQAYIVTHGDQHVYHWLLKKKIK